jgi:hypothetical protein
VTRRPPHPLILIAAVLVAGLLAPAPSAAAPAQEPSSWGVVPAQRKGEPPRPAFLLDLVPGVDVEDVALVVNDGDKPLAVDLYPADGGNLDDGSFALESARQPKDGMGAWIELPFTDAVVQPGKALPVPFTVHVPDDVEPGDHSGGIVAIDAEASAVEEDDGTALSVKQGIGVRVHGRVGGPAHAGIEVLDVSVDTDQDLASLFGAPTTATVTYTLRNSGNLRITPTISVDVGGIGPSAAAEDRQIIDFLPGATATITEEVSGVWPTGLVTATVSASALDTSDSASSKALLVPWALVAMLGGGLAFFIRRRRRSSGAPPAGGGEPARVPVGAPLVVLFAIAAAVVGTTGVRSAGAAEPPTIELSTTRTAPGDRIEVTGHGWPAGEMVQVVVCGNQALDGSADCNGQGYTMRLAAKDGSFSAGMTAFEPPTPCPCVLKASSYSAGPVLMPIDLTGVASQAPESRSSRAVPRGGGLKVIGADVARGSGWGSLFGASADATLAVTVTNTSDVPIESAAVARWGKGSTPTNAIASSGPTRFEPGETVTLEMPFELSPLAVGGYTVAGQLTYGDETATFTTTTSQWPWGLGLVALAVVQLVLLGLRNRARRRLARRGEPPSSPIELGPAPPRELEPGASQVLVSMSSSEAAASDPPATRFAEPTGSFLALTGAASALRVVQLTSHLRRSAHEAVTALDLPPTERHARLRRSERAMRELAEALVLANPRELDRLIDAREQLWEPRHLATSDPLLELAPAPVDVSV